MLDLRLCRPWVGESVARHDPLGRAHRHANALVAFQKHHQLARAPNRVLAFELNQSLLDGWVSLSVDPRSCMAAFSHGFQALRASPFDPLAARFASHPKLAARLTERQPALQDI